MTVAAPPVATTCAWCPDHQRLLAEAEARGIDLSHGMCRRHYLAALADVHIEHKAREARRSNEA